MSLEENDSKDSKDKDQIPYPDFEIPDLRGKKEEKEKKRAGIPLGFPVGAKEAFVGAKGGLGVAGQAIQSAAGLAAPATAGIPGALGTVLAKVAAPKLVAVAMSLAVGSGGYFVYYTQFGPGKKKKKSGRPESSAPALAGIRSNLQVDRQAPTSMLLVQDDAESEGDDAMRVPIAGSVPGAGQGSSAGDSTGAGEGTRADESGSAGSNALAGTTRKTSVGGPIEEMSATRTYGLTDADQSSDAFPAGEHMVPPIYGDTRITSGKLTKFKWKKTGKNTKGTMELDQWYGYRYLGWIKGGVNKKLVWSPSVGRARNMRNAAIGVLTPGRIWTHEGLADTGHRMYNDTYNRGGEIQDPVTIADVVADPGAFSVASGASGCAWDEIWVETVGCVKIEVLGSRTDSTPWTGLSNTARILACQVRDLAQQVASCNPFKISCWGGKCRALRSRARALRGVGIMILQQEQTNSLFAREIIAGADAVAASAQGVGCITGSSAASNAFQNMLDRLRQDSKGLSDTDASDQAFSCN